MATTSTDLYTDALDCLKKIVEEEAGDWDFDKWYEDGVDCYLAREVLYLCIDFLEYDDYDDLDQEVYGLIHEATPEQLARAAWEYAPTMDEFERLWNSDHKVEVAKEFAQCLVSIGKSQSDEQDS